MISKLVPGKYALGAMAALEVGPSLTLQTGDDGTIKIDPQDLFSVSHSIPVAPFGAFTISVGAKGALDGVLQCGGSGCPSELNAHAYYVPGILVSYNTNKEPRKIDLGYAAYSDIQNDFAGVTGLTLTPSIIPYTELRYDLGLPIKNWSLFDASIGYENPISATFCVDAQGNCPGGESKSVSVTASGYATAHVGFLEFLTSNFGWDGEYEVYSVTKSVL